MEILSFAYLSIPLIGAYAMFAMGISAIYRASRVLNLAHGAMAMTPAYVFYTLVVTMGMPRALALPLAVASGALLGVAVEYIFVRRLRPQGATAQTVGTIAVTGLLVALAAKVWGPASLAAPTIFPQGSFALGSSKVAYGNVGLLAVGLVAAAITFAFFRYTAYGLAMRGSAENRTAARLVGVNPDTAASVAWAIGGGLAGLAGILLAAVTSLDPYTLSLQVLPAFVATLIGGLHSLVGAVLGSVVVGLTFGLVPAFGDVPVIGGLMRSNGAPQLVLTVVTFIVMFFRGQRIVGVDDAGSGIAVTRTFRRLDAGRFSNRLIVAFLVLMILPWMVRSSLVGSSLKAMLFSLIAASLVLLIGWVGQISLAQGSFVGLGAFVAALATRELGIGFPVSAVVGALAGMGAAVGLGAVALRVRGLYLAVATLIFAWMTQAYLFETSWIGISGGTSSIPNQVLGRPGAIPSLDLTNRRVLYYIFLAVLAIVFLGLANLRDTKSGRAFFAVRGSEMAAASLGIDVTRTKLIAFSLSGAVAGLAGALLLLEQRTIVPAQFIFTVSLLYLAMAVVGGLTSLGGAIAAGVVFAGLTELFFRYEIFTGWLEVVSAGLLATVLLLYPGGLAAAPDGLRRLKERVASGVSLLDSGLGVAASPVRVVGRMVRRAGSRAMMFVRPTPTPATEKAHVGTRTRGVDWMALADPAQFASNGEAEPDVGATEFSEYSPPPVTEPANGNGQYQAATAAVPAPARPSDDRPRWERTPLIEAEDITVRFGGLTAVSDATLTVFENEIVGLIGPNGAGKTTLFNAILGLNDPATGRVRIHGQDVSGKPPHLRARLGVARTFQVVQLFNDLNVSDNLLVATHMHNTSGLLSNIAAGPRTIHAEREARKRVDRILELLRLREVADAQVTDLPFGLLRMVELGRALVTGAPVLMLDEAASGLNETETDRLVDVVRDVRDLGVSVLLIEHDIRMVTGVSDYMYCLDRGVMISEGTPDEVKRHPDVITAYLGADAEDEGVATGDTEADVNDTVGDYEYVDEPTEAEVQG